MSEEEPVVKLVGLVVGAADRAVLTGAHHATGAAAMRAGLRAAFECALANGLIRIVPEGEWPNYIALDPPYHLPKGRR